MKHEVIESLSLEEAQAKVDILTEAYVIVSLKYSWNGVTGMHRFDVSYVEKNLWR